MKKFDLCVIGSGFAGTAAAVAAAAARKRNNFPNAFGISLMYIHNDTPRETFPWGNFCTANVLLTFFTVYDTIKMYYCI